MGKIVIWIHIPKTGGKSAFEMLKQKYKTLQIYATIGGYVYSDNVDDIDVKIQDYYSAISMRECLKFARNNGYGAILSNAPINVILSQLGGLYDTYETICVLREPLARVYSEYRHNMAYGFAENNFEDFCVRTQDTQYRLTSGDISKFTKVIDFDSFAQEVSKLGFTVEHKNTHDGKPEIDVDMTPAEKYNKLDTELYKQFKSR